MRLPALLLLVAVIVPQLQRMFPGKRMEDLTSDQRTPDKKRVVFTGQFATGRHVYAVEIARQK